MTTRRRILIATATSVASLLLVLALLPLLFRDRIEARVKTALAARMNAHVDWASVGINMFNDFPNVTFGIDDVVVTGTGPFAGDTLVAARRFRLVLDLASVLRNVRGGGPLVIRTVQLDAPVARLRVLEDGTASWHILRPQTDADAAAGRSFALELRALEVRDADVAFDDRRAAVAASLTGLDESLRGDFTQDRFSIETRTSADSVSLRIGGVPYLSNAAIGAHALIDADMKAQRFTVSENELRVNELVLRLAGTVARAGQNLALDLAFQTPGTGFGEILSLVPAIYAQDFASLETSGTMTVSGRVRGEYGATAFPSFELFARVDNGSFRYPDLPLAAREIALDLAISNPGGHADSTIVRLERLHAAIGGHPIDGSLVLRTPVSDPAFEMHAAGRVVLSDLPRTIRLPDVEELTGTVQANVRTSGRMSDIERRAYDRLSAAGTIDVRDLALRSTAFPHPLAVEQAHLTLSPAYAELTRFRGSIGSSDLQGTGRLENLLGFALRDEDLRGTASLRSTRFDLNEWRSEEEAVEAIPVPRRLDFTIAADVARLRFGKLDIADARGTVRIHEERLTLDGFRMGLLGGTMAASGYYETTDRAQPTFDVDVELEAIDIPSAFASLNTVQVIAPVARYAQGRVSADISMAGAMGQDMTPLYPLLTGTGAFETTTLVLHDFPAFGRLADALHVEQLRHPALSALASSFELRDGRVHVQPFDAAIGDMRMNVSGSNGIDRTLDYTLRMELPRTLMERAGVLAGLAARGGDDAGISAARVTLDVAVAGTVTDPAVGVDLASTAGQVRAGVEQALRAEVGERTQAVEARVDTVAAEARRRAELQATELLADAERQAANIRAEARGLAETMRAEGQAKADSLEARAGNPAARIAAKLAADRLRRETNESADRVIAEADARADALVAEARRRAEVLRSNATR